MNRGLSSYFCWLTIANHVEFNEECEMCTEKHIFVKNVLKWAKLLKEVRNSIRDESKPDRPAMLTTHEMVDSVNALILPDRRITIEDIYELLGILCGYCTQNWVWWPFLRSVIVGFHPNNAKPHTATKTPISLFENSCYILLAVKIGSSLNSTYLTTQRISARNKSFKWWWRAPCSNNKKRSPKISKINEYKRLFFDGKEVF